MLALIAGRATFKKLIFCLENPDHFKFTQRFNPETKEISAPTITLSELLDRERVKNIDLLSIDVELHEPKVLAGFDIERFKPALVCIEAKPEVRKPILDYFARHGYVVVGKYLRVDNKNLYFAPLAKSGTSGKAGGLKKMNRSKRINKMLTT